MAAPGIAARRYAEAAFEVAGRDDRYDRWRDDLALAADLLGRDEVEGIVDSPAIPLEQRLGAARELLGDRIGPEALRLVELLVKRGRVRALGGVAAEFARLLNRHRGVITATVTSAAPLTPDESADIRTRVEAMAGSRVDLRTTVDPSIIGGLTVQVGDRLLDASIRGRLERLHAQLNAGARLR